MGRCPTERPVQIPAVEGADPGEPGYGVAMEGTVTEVRKDHVLPGDDKARIGKIQTLNPDAVYLGRATLKIKAPKSIVSKPRRRAAPKTFDPRKYKNPQGQLTRQLRGMKEGDVLLLPSGHSITRDPLTFHLRDPSGKELDSAGMNEPSHLPTEIFHGPYRAALGAP